MSSIPRTPPRFVPTLTEVVHPADEVLVPGATSEPQVHATVLPVSGEAAVLPPSGRHSWAPTPTPAPQPPAPLPWARELALPPLSETGAALAPEGGEAVDVDVAIPSSAVPATALPAAAEMPSGLEEYMVHRVMQRVDLVLDQRLREAIATVVQEQTRSVLPRLREEIESVVRHSVYEAVAEELASGSRHATKG